MLSIDEFSFLLLNLTFYEPSPEGDGVGVGCGGWVVEPDVRIPGEETLINTGGVKNNC